MTSDFINSSKFLNAADLEKLAIARKKENTIGSDLPNTELSDSPGNLSSQRTTRRQRWAQALLDFFTGQQTLSIRKKQLKNKTIQWIVYDPHRDSRHVFDSEAAVRDWLEQRYYQ